MKPIKSIALNARVTNLCKRLVTAARKAKVPLGILEDELMKTLASLGAETSGSITELATGMVVPVRAEDTGLVPKGWSVYRKNTIPQDFLERSINFARLSYGTCLAQGGKPFVKGAAMLDRAISTNAYGSLGFAALLLKAQRERKEIFPKESRQERCYIMPRTILIDIEGFLRVGVFLWRRRKWALEFRRVDNPFDCHDWFVCARGKSRSALLD